MAVSATYQASISQSLYSAAKNHAQSARSRYGSFQKFAVEALDEYLDACEAQIEDLQDERRKQEEAFETNYAKTLNLRDPLPEETKTRGTRQKENPGASNCVKRAVNFPISPEMRQRVRTCVSLGIFGSNLIHFLEFALRRKLQKDQFVAKALGSQNLGEP